MDCRVHLIRPEADVVVAPGGRVSGIGWVASAAAVSAIDIAFGAIGLCQARLITSATDFSMLGADKLPERATGFVFAATLPPREAIALGSTSVQLRLRVRTEAGPHDHAVTLRLPPSAVPAAPSSRAPTSTPTGQTSPAAPQPAAPPSAAPPVAPRRPSASAPLPIRAVIETARIDERGILRVVGWAASLSDIQTLRVFVGERLVGDAQRGIRRDDVAAIHAEYPNALAAGFLVQKEITDEDLLQETVNVVITATGGIERSFAAPLVRPAQVRRRAPEAVAKIVCDEVMLTDRGQFAIKGWAVCASGVVDITIELDDEVIGTAHANEDRPDVGNRYPSIPGAPQAGFRLAQDLGVPFEGDHVLRLTVRGQGGEEAAIFQPVAVRQTARTATASATQSLGSSGEAIRLHLDAPALKEGMAIETVRGFMSLNGWAFGREKLAGIEVFVDGQSQGHAHHGTRRDDLQTAFPDYDALLSGFAMIIPPQVMKPGMHDVRIVARDNQGRSLAMDFSVRAEKAATGPGPWMLRSKLPQSEIDLLHDVLDARRHRPVWTLLLRATAAAIVVPPVIASPPLAAPGVASLGVASSGVPSTAAAGTVAADDAASADPDAASAAEAAEAEESAPFSPPLSPLAATLESLRYQAYDDWRMVLLAEDDAVAAQLDAALDDLAAPRARIRIVTAQPDRMLADQMLTGFAASERPQFLTVLTPGDRLGEDALLELSVETALDARADFLYSDERRVDPADGEDKAFFKPDFSPDLLLSTNYVGRLWVASAALLRRAGLREGDLRSHGEYDAVLRLTEQAQGIRHVPKVLCATVAPAFTPGRAKKSGETRMLERRALRRAMRRRGISGEILPGPVHGTYRLKRDVQPRGKISIIIPTNGARDLVKIALTSIRAQTAWPDYEIICMDNILPDAPPERQACKAWIADHADRIVEILEKFNWSRFNNIGAEAATGDYLLFLNDDIEVHDPLWLHGLVEHAQRPEIGVVGPQLLYPDGRVQHAGVFLARHAARHAFRFYPRDEPGPFGLALTQRDVISVTGACMLMRRAVFDELRGFDEKHGVVNNDLDFNLRVRRAGHAVIYTPAVTLTHHEMVSRSKLADTYNSKRFAREWGDLFLKGDPFFSRYFSPDYDDYLPDAEPVRQFSAGHPLVAREKIKKILAVKVDHIGDFITAFPAFRRIKERFPDAELSVLAARASLSLAAMEPAIDRVIEFNFFHARSEKGRREVMKQELLALQAQLAPERFDLAIDLRRQPDTRLILQHSGARWLAGFQRHYEHPWLDIAVEFEGDIALHWKRSHVTDSLGGLIDAVSAHCESDRQVIHRPATRDAARKLVERVLTRIGATADLDGPVVCVHTGAGAVNKQWPAASFAGLIDLLAGEAGATVLVIGGPDEAAFAQSVIRLARRRDRVTSLVGKTGLRDLAEVLRAANLYIGNDSGPKHMAAAVGVPTIGIHSGSVDSGEWGALGPHALTIRRDMTCSPCYLAHAADCHRGLICLDGIKVGDVFRACQRMLALAPSADIVAEPAPLIDVRQAAE